MRKHSTWLWSIIIVVVIFTFVIWGTNPGSRSGGGTAAYGRINGQVVTEDDVTTARKVVMLQYLIQNGRWPDADAGRAGFDMQREVYYQLLLNQILDQRDIYAGAKAKAALLSNMLQSQSLKSQGINTPTDFENAILKKEGLSLADLDRYLGHVIAVRQLSAAEGLSGELITQQQLQSLWERENQEISAQVVFFSASNYLQSVKVNPGAVATYFTNQMARYRIPDRVQVRYVAYPITNYMVQADQHLASITNLEAQIDSLYTRRGGTNYYTDVTPDQAKKEIRQQLRHQAAVFAARQDAAAFADELWKQEPMTAADMDTVGAQKGLTVKVTEPFDRNSSPEGLDVNSTFTDDAFRLRDDEPFAGPIEGTNHLYVIAMKNTLPSTNAKFEDVKAEVTKDYRLHEATLKARELGRAFAQQATNQLAAGKAFTEVCTKAGYKPQLLPDFSRSTRSLPQVEAHTSLALFKQVAFTTPVGEASRFTPTSDGGYVVYVGGQQPVDKTKMNEDMPQYARFVRQTLANEAFNRWFGEAAQVGLRQTPLNQTPPPEITPSGG